MELTDITIQKIEDFLKSLVKTAKILRFYPENNPMGQVAIDHCLECLAELETDRQFALTVTPENLFIGETSITMAHPGLRQLARQLYILGIENLAFQNNITEKEIKGFCQLLGMDPKEIIEKKGLSKVLAEKTIEHIRIVESQMPGIVEVSKTSTKFFINSIPNKRELNQNLTQENETQKSVGPRSKAVIKINANLKIDPDLKIGADLDLSSLSPKELTKIVDNPEYLVEALLRPSKVQPLNVKKWGTSTGKKFRKTQQLLETLEGWEKSKTLDKISRTMLKMDPDYKDQLTRDCLVPALLEGREEGEILRFLTDSNLAQSISLLGKLDTSTPHTLQKTLLKLHLPERRQSLFLPMLEKELKKRGFQTTNISLLQEQKKANKIAGLDRKNQDLAEKQLPSVVHLNQIKNPDWFLNSLDKQMLKNIRSNPVGIDSKKAELRCLINLTRLEDNLEICRGFISRISDILEKLLKEKQWKSLTFWLNHLRAMNKMISDTKPAIFSLVKEKLSSIASSNLIQYLVKQCSQDNLDKTQIEQKQYLDILSALGEFAIPSFVQLLTTEKNLSMRRTLLKIMLELAPSYDVNAFSPYVNHQHWYVARNIVWLLGNLGPGSEYVILKALNNPNLKVKKEAIRSLISIASPVAIERLLLLLDSEDRIIKRIVAEQLFSLPIKNLQSHAINLLSRESFLKKDIFTTCQLLETLKTMEGEDALKLLEHLSRLRFSFWDWKSLRIGFKARKILKKHKKNFFSNKNSGEKI